MSRILLFLLAIGSAHAVDAMRFWSFIVCIGSLLGILFLCVAVAIYPCWLFVIMMMQLTFVASASMVAFMMLWLRDRVKELIE